jgi:hypothetical protein
LHQHKYARDILERVAMSDSKSCTMLVDTRAKVSSDMNEVLHCLTFIRCDISCTIL